MAFGTTKILPAYLQIFRHEMHHEIGVLWKCTLCNMHLPVVSGQSMLFTLFERQYSDNKADFYMQEKAQLCKQLKPILIDFLLYAVF